MARTVFLSSACTARAVRSARTTPVALAEGTRPVFAPRHEADLPTRPVLSDVSSRVMARRAGHAVIDLAEVEFIDTAAGCAIAVGQQLGDRRGRELTLRSPSRLAARVMDLFGLADLMAAREGAVQ